MVQPIDLREALRAVVPLEGRTKDTPADAEARAFAMLGTYLGSELYVGSFSGESPWERHPGGDEFVHLLAGKTTLAILTDQGTETFPLTGGMAIIVPGGAWHRFRQAEAVTVMTFTPPPTEHSSADDPRETR